MSWPWSWWGCSGLSAAAHGPRRGGPGVEPVRPGKPTAGHRQVRHAGPACAPWSRAILPSASTREARSTGRSSTRTASSHRGKTAVEMTPAEPKDRAADVQLRDCAPKKPALASRPNGRARPARFRRPPREGRYKYGCHGPDQAARPRHRGAAPVGEPAGRGGTEHPAGCRRPRVPQRGGLSEGFLRSRRPRRLARVIASSPKRFTTASRTRSRGAGSAGASNSASCARSSPKCDV